MSGAVLLPGFIAREAAQMNLGLAPNPPNSPNRAQSLGALGGLGGGSKLKSASPAPSPLLPGFDPHAIARAETARSDASPCAGAGLLTLPKIIALVEAISAADAAAAPDMLRRAIRAMLDAGHGRGETLQTLMPAVPLGCDPGALEIAIWDGETPPAEGAP